MFFKKSNRKYGTNFIPPTNTPPPEDPPNQYGSGSIDNSELDILLDDARATERENIMLDMLRKNIKGANNMEEDSKQEPYFNRETGVYEKPPICIMPHKIWIRLRIQELSKALERYSTEIDGDKRCMIELSKELTMLLNEYFEEK